MTNVVWIRTVETGVVRLGGPASNGRNDASVDEGCRATSARCACAVALLLGLLVVPIGRPYETPPTLNDVARFYSLGVGEVRCASPAEWKADAQSQSSSGYTNIRKEHVVLAPHVCAGALNVASTQVPAWQRALGTLVLVHEAFHLRHWRFRRDEGKVECQAIVYFTEAARKLGASEAEANNLYPYALAWHWRRTQLYPWYRDPTCVLPPWIAPAP
jgi:hypothetical protein